MKHIRKIAVAWFILAMLIPSALSAKEKPGAWLRIEKNDGSTEEGELLKVSGETLLLFDGISQHSSQVNFGDVLQLGLRRRDVLGGLGIGLLAGIGAGIAGGLVFKSREPCENVGIFMAAMVTCIPAGALAGMATNGFHRRFKKRDVSGMTEAKRRALMRHLQEMSREAINYHPRTLR